MENSARSRAVAGRAQPYAGGCSVPRTEEPRGGARCRGERAAGAGSSQEVLPGVPRTGAAQHEHGAQSKEGGPPCPCLIFPTDPH